jgi:rare lipoprotein A
MEFDLHTTEIRLLGLLPQAESVRLKTQPVRIVAMLLVLSCCLNTAIPAPKTASAAAASATLPASKPASTAAIQATPATPGSAAHPVALDRTGKARKGRASYYGRNFYAKKMADGTAMDPQSNVAASKTLPLGTKARVTNLQNGASEVVEIRDRGPYIKNRIVDVSPKTADKLGLKEDGTAPVVVKPIEVPQSDGSVKPGAGAEETPRGKSSVDAQDRHAAY